jgi:hypothetical protein
MLKIATLLFLVILLSGCEKEEKAPVVTEVRHYKGDVEVLNSCGIPGAASKMTAFLRQNGFDVIISRNDRLQNYDETVVVLRDSIPWEGAEALAKALRTENVMTIKDDRRNFLVASIYIGKDFKKIIEPEQGETNDN